MVSPGSTEVVYAGSNAAEASTSARPKTVVEVKVAAEVSTSSTSCARPKTAEEVKHAAEASTSATPKTVEEIKHAAEASTSARPKTAEQVTHAAEASTSARPKTADEVEDEEISHLATRLQGHPAETGETPSRITHLDLHEQSDIESDADNSKQQESEMESKEGPRYGVEQITDSRIQDGVRQYRVKRVGYDQPTWGPASVSEHDAPDEVKQHEHTRTPATRDQATRRSARPQKADDKATSFESALPASSSNTNTRQTHSAERERKH